jgi:NAD(P)-dependent dehydrogenase (short-subunit alcohol dehydrogenase family)
MKLRGKTAIVTGAGKGIGRAIAVELASQGANVVINYAHSKAGAEAIAQKVKNLGQKAIVIKADISQAAEVNHMVETTIREFNQLNILVNNAGVTIFKDFFEVTEADWDFVHGINLKGAFLCSQAAARKMIEVGGGKIINIGSVHSHVSLPEFTPYAASKGGLNTLTTQMALALAPYKINVNSIAPGLIEVEKIRQDPIYNREHRARQIPLGRVGLPEDISKAVTFFASDDSDFTTGQILFVDGGQLTKLCMERKFKNNNS